MGRLAIMLAVLAGLAACQPVPPQGAQRPSESEACGASRFQVLLGQPEAALRAMVLPDPHRVIPHGAAVTMDYNPSRLNIELDKARRVARISCY